MFLMHADPLLGQVGGGWALEISTFLGLKRLDAISQGQKSLDFQGPIPSHLPRNGSARIKSITYGAI